MTLIFSAWSGHDSSFSFMEDGVVDTHIELERWIREKEVKADSVKYALMMYEDRVKESDTFVTISPSKIDHPTLSGKQLVTVGHHTCHAYDAFFSSNFLDEECLVVTMDGGGVESDWFETAFTAWRGRRNKLTLLDRRHINSINIGGLWTRATRYVFKLQSGWPKGHAAGTVMAMAAFGDPKKYHDDFMKMLTTDLVQASMRPRNQPAGAVVPDKDPVHPYLDKWRKIGEKNEQELFDLAAGLQSASETLIRNELNNYLKSGSYSNVCLSGGVALNSVMTGKIREWFPSVKDVYIPPTPHDGGLTIGASLYTWHKHYGIPRRDKQGRVSTPYLGMERTPKLTKHDVIQEVASNRELSVKFGVQISDVVELLDSQKIVALYMGSSESGRRALGHRSILADPRNPMMKSMINEKVKHRQWFRPFAPSILREHVSDWFEGDIDSPYMSFVLKFKKEAFEKIPAVVHFDGTARLQTVTKRDNGLYYDIIKAWHEKTGVPVLLNTSYNDTEPVTESVRHALNCFLRTEIDYVYFADIKALVSRV